MYDVRIDYLLASILGLACLVFFLIALKKGYITGKATFTLNITAIKDIKFSDVFLAIGIFIGASLLDLYILGYTYLNNYLSQTLIIALLGSLPIVWRKYYFSGIFLIGLILGGIPRPLIWSGEFLYTTLAIAFLLGVLAELVSKGFLKRTAVLVCILVVVLILLWLPGVSFTLEGVLMEEVEDVKLMHRESFASRDIVVYRVTFAGDDLCYIVDEITRPLGFLHRSQWFSGWGRGHPEIGFYEPGGRQPRAFVSFVRRVDNEFFIYIEPQTERVEYLIIGNFDDKVYTLEEAKDSVDRYHLIRSKGDYIVLREGKDCWPEIWEEHVYSHPSVYSHRSPGIIAFDERGRLLGGSIFSVYWF